MCSLVGVDSDWSLPRIYLLLTCASLLYCAVMCCLDCTGCTGCIVYTVVYSIEV